MKTLATEFTELGFNFRQISRENSVAIYERHKPGVGIPHYEVIVVRQRPAFTIGGVAYPEAEVYPPNEKWGMSGFTLTTMDAAIAKANSLAI
jgi:hypothetical protein